jgi:lipopolysaccharide export system protein LptC
MQNKIESKLVYLIGGSVLLGSLLVSSTAFAAGPGMGGVGHTPGVFGTVSAISGSTLTVASKGFGSKATSATYTVDATHATVTKSGASSSLSTIVVGDTVAVQGTISGTTVTATTIRDGMMGRGGMGRNKMNETSKTQTGGAAPVIQGNGQPVIGGNVTAVNGSVLTVTNKSNVTYTVDATNAVVEKGNATSTISAVVVGDTVVAQGTVNGTSVTASSVIDSGTPPAPSTTGTTQTHQSGVGGFFGGIGGFFHSFFGFF